MCKVYRLDELGRVVIVDVNDSIMTEDVEIWKDVVGYDGLYQISSYGRVKSFKQCSDGRILKPGLMGIGYNYVVLSKNNKAKNKRIHRLVCQAFDPTYTEELTVNHIDGCKINNHLSNLEMMTHAENNKHARDIGLNPTMGTCVGVNQYNIDGEFIKSYDSYNEAGRQTGVNCGNISKCANGKQNQSGGFIWKIHKTH